MNSPTAPPWTWKKKPNLRANHRAPGLTIQYKTFEDLRLYCYRVASVVGLVCIHIFGYRDPAAEPLAERCGLAFQLTNIIRDVKEDAAMGRIYLPEEDLAKFNLSAAELLATPDPARFRPVLALEADRAREFYASGEELMPYISEDSQPALWVLVTIYRRLLGTHRRKTIRRLHRQSRPQHLGKIAHPRERLPEALNLILDAPCLAAFARQGNTHTLNDPDIPVIPTEASERERSGGTCFSWQLIEITLPISRSNAHPIPTHSRHRRRRTRRTRRRLRPLQLRLPGHAL